MKYLFALLFIVSCSSTKDPGQTTVDHVDLERLTGNWYEVARYETPLQKDCGAAKINIKVIGKKIHMLHACHEKESGKTAHAHGIAEVTDKKSNAKFKTSYVPLFQKWGMFGGSIWVVGLDPEYNFAILGHPTHKHLWILSRNKEVAPEKLEELILLAESKGYKRKLIQNVPVWK